MRVELKLYLLCVLHSDYYQVCTFPEKGVLANFVDVKSTFWRIGKMLTLGNIAHTQIVRKERVCIYGLLAAIVSICHFGAHKVALW